MRCSIFDLTKNLLLFGRAFFCALLIFISVALNAEQIDEKTLTQSLALLRADSHLVASYDELSSSSLVTATVLLNEFPPESYQGEIFEYAPEQALVLADDEWSQFDAENFKNREAFITRFLTTRFKKSDLSENQHGMLDLAAELELMAAYFAKHEQAYQLIKRLDSTALKFEYAPQTFITRVKGNRLQVKSVTIAFDPMTSARVTSSGKTGFEKASMSAADALLHEMLHAEMALINSKAFIASGGLGGLAYPYEHEQQVIAKERKLFGIMSRQDGLPRPQRHHHQGTLLASNCSTCL